MSTSVGHLLRFGGIVIVILANLPEPYGQFGKYRWIATILGITAAVAGAYMNGEVINFVQ